LRALGALAAALALAGAWVGLSGNRDPEALRITILDVGQGDSAVIESPRGLNVVIDAGRSFEDGDSGRQIVLPFLRSRGINRLDALLLTHADDDHIGGARTLLERIRVQRLLIPVGESSRAGFGPLRDTASRKKIPILELGAGHVLDFGDGASAEVLNPLTPLAVPGEKDNDRSLVLRLRHGRNSILFAGDAEEAAESAMCRRIADLSADILKAGHHGSRTSTSDRFLTRVNPQVAIISAGRRNSFGHPHQTVLSRLARRGIRAFRTDRHGAISIASDGAALRIRTQQPPE
jgi:competence protein ComEC